MTSAVRQRSLREANLALVLRHIGADGAITRADLAARTGLTRATVSGLVDELMAGGLVSAVPAGSLHLRRRGEPSRQHPGAGRPATGLALATTGPAGLGLEINVDYLAACALDLTGATRVLQVQRRDQRGRRPTRVLADLAGLAARVREAATRDGLRVAGIVVGVPGLVNGDGMVRVAPNLDWHNVDVGTTLRDAPGLHGEGSDALALTVENEANLAALAELHAHSDPSPSFVHISGEIGVGAGLVLQGRLLRGPRGYGGELGHVTISPDGPRCRCGARGCLEAYTNQEALLRAAGLLSTVEDVPPVERLRELAGAGDAAVLRALADAGTALGIAAADVVNLVDVDTVVLGGIFAPLTPWLAPAVSRELTARTVTAAWAPVTVRAAALGTTATVVGAAGSVVRAIRESPATWLSHLSADVDT
ncbi:MAG TPA: ROK family transcriptional regulator [Micromonosporaceae bacterium]|jgi:predicted NBD/HSP70 family sugar kinase